MVGRLPTVWAPLSASKAANIDCNVHASSLLCFVDLSCQPPLGAATYRFGNGQWQGYKLYDGPAVLEQPSFINYNDDLGSG